MQLGMDFFQRIEVIFLMRFTGWMGFRAMNRESSTIVKLGQKDFSIVVRNSVVGKVGGAFLSWRLIDTLIAAMKIKWGGARVKAQVNAFARNFLLGQCPVRSLNYVVVTVQNPLLNFRGTSLKFIFQLFVIQSRKLASLESEHRWKWSPRYRFKSWALSLGVAALLPPPRTDGGLPPGEALYRQGWLLLRSCD